MSGLTIQATTVLVRLQAWRSVVASSGGEMATSSGGKLNRLEATTRVVQPGSVRSCWASYFKKNNVLLVTFILN